MNLLPYHQEHAYVEAKTGGSSDGNPLSGRSKMRRAIGMALDWREDDRRMERQDVAQEIAATRKGED